MPIKLSRDQRRRVQSAISQMNAAANTLDEVHEEVCEQPETRSASEAIRIGTAIHAMFRLSGAAHDAINMAERALARDRTKKPLRRKRTKWLTLPEIKERDE